MKHPFSRGREPDAMKMFKKNKTLITGLSSVALVLFFVTSVLISGQATKLSQTSSSLAAGPGVVSYRDWTCNSINFNAALVPNQYGNSYSVAIVDIATGRYINDSTFAYSTGTDIPRTTVTFNKPLTPGVTVRAQLLNYTSSTAYGYTEVGQPYSFTPACQADPPPGSGVPDIRGNVTFSNLSCTGLNVDARVITGTNIDIYSVNAKDTTGSDHRTGKYYIKSDGREPATLVPNPSTIVFDPPLVNAHKYTISLENVDGTVALTGFPVRNPNGGSTDISYTANCPPVVAVPPAPASVSAVCAPDGKSANISWSPVSGATGGYYLRVDAPDRIAACSPGSNYDRCLDKLQTTSYAVTPVLPDVQYNVWVHAANTNGYNGGIGPAASTTFKCSVPPTQACTDKKINIALSLDTSGSMSGSEIKGLNAAANAFVNRVKTRASTSKHNISVAVTTFNDKALVKTNLTDVLGLNPNYSFSASGGTGMAAGIALADTQLQRRTPVDYNAVLLMTDGKANLPKGTLIPGGPVSNDPESPDRIGYAENIALQEVDKSNSANKTIFFTVAYGKSTDYNGKWLSGVASRTGGKSYTTTNVEQLDDIFNTIADSVCTLKPRDMSTSEYNSLLNK